MDRPRKPASEIVPAIWNDIRRIVGGDYEREPERYRHVSPIAHVSDHAPPILLMQAENEDMFPQALTDAFMQKMRDHGRQVHCIEYANAEHGFFYDVTRRCQQDALRDLLRFIKHHHTASADTHINQQDKRAGDA